MQEVIADEEAAFSSMLSRGIKEFNARAEAIKAGGKAGFDGQAALANPHPYPDPNPDPSPFPNPTPIPNPYPIPNPNRDPSPNPIPNRRSSPNPKPEPTPGQAAFFLYDSMGFPLDLTELMAREVGLEVDVAGFQAAMEEQKARSAAAAAASKVYGLGQG